MKTLTKIGIAALILAVSTVVHRFHLARQVNLPDDRTAFVLVFLAATILGVVVGSFDRLSAALGCIIPPLKNAGTIVVELYTRWFKGASRMRLCLREQC